ncbi:MAG: cbb3-type cytochrome oxidase subunit 3 [Bacteroidota bacterium]
MDINELRSLVTVAGLFCFLAIIAWAFSGERGKDFAEAANLPFTDPEELDLQRKALLLRRY